MKGIRVGVVMVAVAALGITYQPTPAQACGGFFCSNLPIDQSAERIIFAQEGNLVTAWVQIVFNGNAEDFAWVVPVATVPEVDVADSLLFQDIDQATQVQIIPPACAFPAFDADGAESAPTSGGGARNDDGVIIYNESDVGPYHTATVGSESSELLIEWLDENGYVITPAMYPMVDEYVNDDMLFLAMKLQIGQGVDAIQPVVMTYEADRPVVPIRLTAVAADPNMGILVWLVGDGRAVSGNYTMAEVNPSEIRFNGFLQSNYRTLVTETVDNAGGHAFVTEYAGPIDNLFFFSEEGEALREDYSYVTRLYTTMSPEEMTVDPVFTFNPNLPDVSNIIDLSDRTDLCEDPDNSPCDFNYCGPEATCYVVNNAAACECGDGMVARGIPDPVTGTGITCVPEDRDMLEDVTGDPCQSVTCGEFGECINVNGNATCECSVTAVAGLFNGGVACIEVSLAQLDPREANLRPGNDSQAGSEMGCSTTNSSNPLTGALLVVGLLGLALVRRRSRSDQLG